MVLHPDTCTSVLLVSIAVKILLCVVKFLARIAVRSGGSWTGLLFLLCQFSLIWVAGLEAQIGKRVSDLDVRDIYQQCARGKWSLSCGRDPGFVQS